MVNGILGNDTTIIAVDNGNGNTKTEHCVFKTGLKEYDHEPVVTKDFFKLNDKYYIAGEEHMTYQGDKTENDDCYILTMIAVVKELEYRHMTSARVQLALGLPLAWCRTDKKEELKNYMLKAPTVEIEHNGELYHIEIVSVDVFPQGFSAIYGRYDMDGFNMIADIGDGTIDIMHIDNGVPKEDSISTERKGVGICVKSILNELAQRFSDDIPEEMVEPLLRDGCDKSTSPLADTVRSIASSYGKELVKIINDNGFKEGLVKLYIIGGGGCLLKNFTDIGSRDGVVFVGDICANAKGYALLAKKKYGVS